MGKQGRKNKNKNYKRMEQSEYKVGREKNSYHQSDHQHYWVEANPEGTTGLKNIGNSCYFNAVIQCLVHTDGLRKYFLQNQVEYSPMSENNCAITLMFKEFLQSIWHEGQNVVDLSDLKNNVGMVNSLFEGYEQ